MKFADHIARLQPVEDYEIEIILTSGEKICVPNIEGKQASLRLLQNHLAGKPESSQPFEIQNFCEYHDEWLQNPEGHHTTIAFLDRYNREGGIIKKI